MMNRSDNDNPMNECPDDTVCYYCGAKLPEIIEPETWPDNGFCNNRCYQHYQRGDHLPEKKPK